MNILINGVGKTGTTAMFYSIRQALTGSVTELFEPAVQEFDAALSASSQHVLAKVLLHDKTLVPFERFPWKVMMTRDPRDTLVSRLLYSVWHAGFRFDAGSMDAYLTLLRVKERDPFSIPLKELYSAFAAFQRQNPYREYLRVLGGLAKQQELLGSRPDFFVQRYEDFVDGRLENLSAYLGGLDLDHRVRVHPEVARVERRKGHGDWRHWFTPSDVSFFRPMLAPALQALGYDDDWKLAEVPTIEPRFCSEYAERLNADRVAQIRTLWPPAPPTHAELRPDEPEMLLRLAHASSPPVSVTPISFEQQASAGVWPDDLRFLIRWEGEPLIGDVCLQFHFDSDSAEPLTRLRMDFGEGFHDRMSLILPATRGDNLLCIRFHQPVAALGLCSVNSEFRARDVRLHVIPDGSDNPANTGYL